MKRAILVLVPALVLLAWEPARLALVVPVDIQMPGTQPGEITNLGLPAQCDNCHAGYDASVEPARTWRQGMMAHATRDPLFWAAVAVTEQNFEGAGDLCIRCHAPRGWTEGRSSPTDGSGLTANDVHGVECAICHKLVNPDDSEHVGVQNPPYLAHGGSASPEGFYGSGMMVLRAGHHRLGPYADATAAPHGVLQSEFHRKSEFCGTCHDVSNSLVGDVSHNNGAQVPLPSGTFVGTLGGPLASKAAFQNAPYRYGVVERTFSEHAASAWMTTPVSAYPILPVDLKAGAVALARAAALLAGQGGDYADGTARTFTCQSCHMRPAVGKGASQSQAPVRADLPTHDAIGGNTWVPGAIEYLNAQNGLVLGNGLSTDEIAALNEGQAKAATQLTLAASLSVNGNTLRVVNLTGHKLITGYPEGRRMWINVKWRGAGNVLLREDGAYGMLGVTLPSGPAQVATILNPSDPNTRIYETKLGITQEWAAELVALGIPAGLVASYDRVTGAPTMTIGQIAALPPGSAHETFHFAFNNVTLSDNRIPPYGMTYAAALARNVLPVPSSAYGNPGPGGIYQYWDDLPLSPPAGALTATIELLYQTTSWEYVQFLRLANDGTTFLGSAGLALFDAWWNTGMSPPQVMASASWTASCGMTASWANYGTGLAGTAGVPALTLSAAPVLGTTVFVTVGNASGVAAPAALVIGSSSALLPTPLVGTLLVAPDLIEFVNLPSDGLVVPVSISGDPAACGQRLFGQVVHADAGATAGYAFSRGIELTLGN